MGELGSEARVQAEGIINVHDIRGGPLAEARARPARSLDSASMCIWMHMDREKKKGAKCDHSIVTPPQGRQVRMIVREHPRTQC